MNAAHQSNIRASDLDATLKPELLVNNADKPEVSTTVPVPEQTIVSFDVSKNNNSIITNQESLILDTNSISVTLPQVHSRTSAAPSIQLDGLSITKRYENKKYNTKVKTIN